MEDNNRSNNILYSFTLGDATQCDTAQFYFTSKSPKILYWSKAYMDDKEKNMMLKNIQK